MDPDGVAGVLAGVDDTASRFEKSRDEIEEAAFERGETLIADGRTTLSSAWEVFLEDRRLVPGKIMYAINAAAGAVSEATVAVVTGDEEMASELWAQEQRAAGAWGIAPPPIPSPSPLPPPHAPDRLAGRTRMSGVTLSLPSVLSPAALNGLADRADAAASAIDAAMTDAVDRWGRLSEVFDIAGADGAYSLLERPRTAVDAFTSVVGVATTNLRGTALWELPALQSRRDRLAERIVAVNHRLASAIADAETVERAYAAAGGDGQTSPAAREASSARMPAWRERMAAESAVGELDREISQLREDIEHAEEGLARTLRGLTGGDEVSSAGGTVGISQNYWGASQALYPGAVGAAVGLEERFTRSLSDASARRISWMGRADHDDVRAWVDGHPDFAAAVGMVDPAKAQRLWSQLAPASADQLFALAPFAIGNLNGISSAVKHRFNRESLDQLLARDDLRSDYRAHLEKVEEELDKPDRPKLLSLFQETVDGSPRASIGWGDLDGADQITTLSHGIGEDLAMLPNWAGSARAMQDGVSSELATRNSSATTATVLFLEWDYGWIPEVEHIERPDNGAVRLAHLLNGFKASSPDVQLNLALHSLGTTMGTQMIADHPKLVSNAWLYGSAGINGQTAHELERQIRDENLRVHATYSNGDGLLDGDFIAPVGRMGEHPVDPDDIPEVEKFSSEAGPVRGFDAEGRHVIVGQGERTEGHNPQRSTELFYRFDGFHLDPISNRSRLVLDDEAVGYLDPTSRSFRQSVVDMADAIVNPRKGKE